MKKPSSGLLILTPKNIIDIKHNGNGMCSIKLNEEEPVQMKITEIENIFSEDNPFEDIREDSYESFQEHIESLEVIDSTLKWQ